MATPKFSLPVDLQPRPLRFPEEGEIASLAHNELGKVYAGLDRQLDELLVALACARHCLDSVQREAQHEAARMTAEAVATLASQMDQLLDAWQVRYEDRAGQPWNSDWVGAYELRGHTRNDQLQQTVIAHVERPIVRRGDRLLAKSVATLEGPLRQ